MIIRHATHVIIPKEKTGNLSFIKFNVLQCKQTDIIWYIKDRI